MKITAAESKVVYNYINDIVGKGYFHAEAIKTAADKFKLSISAVENIFQKMSGDDVS